MLFLGGRWINNKVFGSVNVYKIMSTWNREQTLWLIKFYKQYPHLYDKNNNYYLNRVIRERALHMIANKLKPVRPKTRLRDLRLKIKTLKSQYLKEQDRFRLFQRTKKAYTPKLWCYEKLKFLYATGKTSDSNIPDEITSSNHVSGIEIEQELYKHDSSIGKKLESQQPADCGLDGEVVSPVNHLLETTNHLVNALSARISVKKKPKYAALAKFISEELDFIEDHRILEETKWKIQLAVRNALETQRKKIH